MKKAPFKRWSSVREFANINVGVVINRSSRRVRGGQGAWAQGLLRVDAADGVQQLLEHLGAHAFHFQDGSPRCSRRVALCDHAREIWRANALLMIFNLHIKFKGMGKRVRGGAESGGAWTCEFKLRWRDFNNKTHIRTGGVDNRLNI